MTGFRTAGSLVGVGMHCAGNGKQGTEQHGCSQCFHEEAPSMEFNRSLTAKHVPFACKNGVT
jgi:hypothetical protein